MTENLEGAQESMNESRTCAPINARLTRGNLGSFSSYREALRPVIRTLLDRIDGEH